MGCQFYYEIFSLERCLLSVTLPQECLKTHRNCKSQIPFCPSDGHNILLCVAQAEIQSPWGADEWFGAQVVIPKILGYHHRCTFMLLVGAGKVVVLSENVVMHFLYKSKTCFCSGAVWCRSQDDGNWGRNMKGTVKCIRRDWWVLRFHVSNLGACSYWQ